MTNVRVEGLERLVRVIGRACTDLPRAIGAATFAIGEQIRGTIAVYPPMPKYPLRWASKRQRAAYFATRRGLGPYVRVSDPHSQQLGKSWATARHGSISAVVGTRATYAPYVQSAQQQQPFHADTGWVTDEQAVKRVSESGVIDDIFRDVLHAALR